MTFSTTSNPLSGKRKHNLPVQITPFVGRDRDLAELKHLLGDPVNRLITILGPGGIGKTRLSLEIAAAQLDYFEDGVYFVLLAALTSPDAIIPAIAKAARFQFRAGGEPRQQLLDFLREKEVLLVMDNFEHILGGAAFVADTLRQAPKVKILTTSREKLNLQEETLFRIGGMSLPEANSLDDAPDSDAVRLFQQGAQRAHPGFELKRDDLEHTIRICQLVDGLPLGILLAAAWAEMFSPQEIADEIARGLDILETKVRNMPERHRSIRAVFESAWWQLSESERQIFAGLSVFRGGFTRQAAQSVTRASQRQLVMLCEKSLAHRDRTGRYHIHQFLLQYASEKLDEHPAAVADIRARHSHYFADLLRQRIRDFSGDQFAQAMQEVEGELENIRAGWRWVVEYGGLTQIAEYSEGLWHYFEARGWYLGGSEDVALYEVALHRVRDLPRDVHDWPRACSRLHESLGDNSMLSGKHDDTANYYEEALAHVPEEESIWKARLHRKTGNVRRDQHRVDEAIELYDKAEAALGSLSPDRDTLWWQEWIQIQLERTWLYYWQGEWHTLTRLNDHVRPKVEQFGTFAQQVNFFNALAAMTWRRERYFLTQEHLVYSQIALNKSLESGNPNDIAWSQFTHGFALLWYGDLDQSENLMQNALALAQLNGDHVHQARCLTYLTMLYRRRGDVEAVRQFAGQSLAVARAANMPEYVGSALANQAWLAWCDGDLFAVETRGREAFKIWDSVGRQHASIVSRWTAIWPLIGLALKEGQLGTAVTLAQQVIDPSQQRLADELTATLINAVKAWEENRPEATQEYLKAVLAQSDDLLPKPGFSAVRDELKASSCRSLQQADPAEMLTPREIEVLELIAAGLSNTEIAERLVVNVGTVKKHINHLFNKLGVDSRTRAIVRARELRII